MLSGPSLLGGGLLLKGTIVLDGKSIEYVFEHKRVKNINMRIRNDGSIYISAPYYVSQKKAESLLLSKGDFILKGLDSISRRPTESCHSPVIEAGSYFTILGNRISIDEVARIIEADYNDKEKFQKRYEAYRRQELQRITEDICREVYPYFKIRTGRDYPEIKYRQMTSRWGVCMPGKNRITFSYNLFETPIECIRYVVCHEFTHFLVLNHSDKFYKELSKTYPNYEEARRILRKFSV